LPNKQDNGPGIMAQAIWLPAVLELFPLTSVKHA